MCYCFQFFCSILIIFALEIAVGIVGFIYRNDVSIAAQRFLLFTLIISSGISVNDFVSENVWKNS
jgi:hypothetical protein